MWHYRFVTLALIAFEVNLYPYSPEKAIHAIALSNYRQAPKGRVSTPDFCYSAIPPANSLAWYTDNERMKGLNYNAILLRTAPISNISTCLVAEVGGAGNDWKDVTLEWASSAASSYLQIHELDQALVIDKREMQLGLLSALRVKCKFNYVGSVNTYVADYVVALTPRHDYVYIVLFLSALEVYETDKPLFDAYLKSWEWLGYACMSAEPERQGKPRP